MNGSLLGLVELLLVFGALLWFGVSQLRALKRDRREKSSPADDDSAEQRRSRDSE